jgi:hypothetical protein
MAAEIALWRTLKVGDKIRLVEYPPEFLQPGYVIFPETVCVYKKLLKRKSPLVVREIDEYGLPWVHCRFRQRNGRYEWHSLAVNHDGIAKVNRRKR